MKHPSEMTLAELRAMLWRDSISQEYCKYILEAALHEQENIKQYAIIKDATQISQYEKEKKETKHQKELDAKPVFILPDF
jgi:hypothetical protein